MPVNLSIAAEVIDIRTDSPTNGDIFLIDTNVWLWMTYARQSLADNPPRYYQTTHYPSYIARALAASSTLLRCGLSLSELAHQIEKTEREVFNRNNPSPKGTKEYRHNLSSERQNVALQITTAWGQVKTMASPLENVIIDEQNTDEALSLFNSHRLDGYDLFMLNAIQKAGITQIITDDGDFATIPNIRVFTSNSTVIQAASAQGKLIVR